MADLPNRTQRLSAALAVLSPMSLKITDFSERHKGHPGAEGEQTHIAIMIVAKCFAGKTRVARERMVHQCLGQEWQEGLHALTIKAFSEDEV